MQENNLSSLENTKIEQADTPSLYFVFMYQSYSSVVRPWHQVNQVGLFNKLFSKDVKYTCFHYAI